jgi:peptidoglycan/LPS O-acetylase OafA/YrhL
VQIPQLTFLRFLAALGVVVFHFGQATAPFSHPWLLPIVQQAGLGVGFFFTLSGFLMAWVYAPQPKIDLRKYAQTRFARIYPLYLLTFILALLAEVLIRYKRPRGLSIVLQALGLQAWVPGYSLTLNFPGWSVSVELFFYLVFPLLLYALRGRRPAVLIGVATGLSVLCYLLYAHVGEWTQGIVLNENSDFSMRFPPWHLHSFVTGMVGGLLYQGGWLRIQTRWLPTVGFLLLSGFMLSLVYFPNPIIDNAADGLLAPLYLGMIICLAQDTGPLKVPFSAKPLQFAGEMSYALYLIQAPVYIALEPVAQWSGASGLQGGWFYIYLAVLLVASGLVYQFFERPMRGWLRPK